MNKIFIWLCKFMPLLYVEIQIPFFSVRSSLWRHDFCRTMIEYTMFEVRLWRWKVEFSLYDTTRRFLERRKNDGHI